MRDSRLHDARHTAATVLFLLGVSDTVRHPAPADLASHQLTPEATKIPDRVKVSFSFNIRRWSVHRADLGFWPSRDRWMVLE